MIVVFASPFDPAARALVARWKRHDASLLTCTDLSVAGWRHYVGTRGSCTGVIDGEVIPVDRISGVLIRWPGVFPQELTDIAAADRDYVAGEMTAFLVSWLSAIRCPVINRPTPLNLSGPAWRPEQWAHAAAQLGIPAQPAHRRLRSSACRETREERQGQPATVTVLGERCFGSDEPVLCANAVRLAKAAGAFLLNVAFDRRWFLGADLIPALSDEVADAVLDVLLGRRSPSPSRSQ